MRKIVLLIDGHALEPIFDQYQLNRQQACAVVGLICHQVFTLPVERDYWGEIAQHIRRRVIHPVHYHYIERLVRAHQELSMSSRLSTPDLSIVHVSQHADDFAIELNQGGA